jgi:hypothetical protein
MKNKSLILVVTLIAIAAMLVSGGTVMAADGWHGGHGSGGWHGGGHGWNGGHGGYGGGYWRGGWGWWGWPYFGLGVATGAILSYPYYYLPYNPYYSYNPYYGPYGYAPAYSPSTTVIVREREPVYADDPGYSEPARTRSSAGATWYYCKQSNAYYPYVRRCAGGWEKVPAIPLSSGPDSKAQ